MFFFYQNTTIMKNIIIRAKFIISNSNHILRNNLYGCSGDERGIV